MANIFLPLFTAFAIGFATSVAIVIPFVAGREIKRFGNIGSEINCA